MNTTDKLLPCPFCGVGSDRIILSEQEPHTHAFATFMPDHPGSATIECGGCCVGMIDDTVEGVVAAWNVRATQAAGSAAVPDGWREFIELCSTFAGREVNGNGLAKKAAILLAVAAAQPNCGACPGDGSICNTSCRVVDESPPAVADHRAVAKYKDFAKIILGTNGQQVLFYKSFDGDINELHCIASFPNYQSDMKLSGIPDAAFETALDRCDVAMADKIIAEGSVFAMDGLI